MRYYKGKYITNDELGYSFYYLGREYFVNESFKSSPSVPRKIVEELGIKWTDAQLVARGHDYMYKYKIGTWFKADTWLFKALKELGYKLGFLEKAVFRIVSLWWWIT